MRICWGDDQLGRVAVHRSGIVADEEDHGLRFEVFLAGEDAVDLVPRRDQEIAGIDRGWIGNLAEADVGFEHLAQGRLLVEDLAETAVTVGQVIGEAGQRPPLPFLLEVGQLKLFGQDAAEIVGIGVDLMAATFPLAGPGAFPFLTFVDRPVHFTDDLPLVSLRLGRRSVRPPHSSA